MSRPRVGGPAACVGLVEGAELPLLPQAARLPVRATPAAPANNCRRERSTMSEPLLFVGADAARGPGGQVPVRAPDPVPGGRAHAGLRPAGGGRPANWERRSPGRFAAGRL